MNNRNEMTVEENIFEDSSDEDSDDLEGLWSPSLTSRMSIRITRPSFTASLHSIDEFCEDGRRSNAIINNQSCDPSFLSLHSTTKHSPSSSVQLNRKTFNLIQQQQQQCKAFRSNSTPNLQTFNTTTNSKPTQRTGRRSSEQSLPTLKEGLLSSSSSSKGSFSSLCSDRHNGIQHSTININNVMTWISFVLPDVKDHSDTVVVVIPGNPGAIEFYDRFIEQLFQQCNLPIFGISHAGHNLIPSKSLLIKRVYKEMNPKVKQSDKHVFTLEEQIAHKVAFIRQHIDPTKKIILVAHSLGSYITLKMLERMDEEEKERVKQVILLFPVFERTMETRSGRKWVPLTRILQKPAIKTTKLVEMLPTPVKKTLIDFIASKRKFSSDSKDSLSNGIGSLVTPNGLKNMSQIAKDLSKIGNRGNLDDIIRHFDEKLTFYYGASDLWTPLTFYQDMKVKFPYIDIRLDDKGIGHAFVLNHSTLVTPIVASIIKEKTMLDDIAETGSCHSYRDFVYQFAFKRSGSYKSGNNKLHRSLSRMNTLTR